MRKRDLGILILASLSIFFSLQKEGSFSFREAWFHLHDETYPIKHEAERLPPPIVADLNGDGRNEVIIATHQAKLQVIEPHFKHTDDGFHEARLLAEVSLLPERVRIQAGRRPVAMAVGTLERSKSGKPQKQVIVVVTAGWVIMCFDHNLKKLWETNVQDDFPHGAYHKEVSIHISNYTINHGDVGLVIVGGSVEVQPQVHLDPFEEELIAEKEAERHRQAAEAKEKAEDVNAGKSHHFTYYAFGGLSGALRWSHKGRDFLRDESSSTELIPQHNYKLDVSMLGRHPEAQCREYRESILSVMPHRWQSRDDTRLELMHFRKHPRKHKKLPNDKRKSLHPPESHAPGKDPKNKVAQLLGKTAEYAAGSKPRKKHNFVPVITNHTKLSWSLPNVLVAHLKEGIQVLQLANGETVCKLWLQEGGLHADINGDGVLDHIQAIGGERIVVPGSMEAIRPCSAIATSGVPVRERLFNGSICKQPGISAFQNGDFGSRTFRRNLDGVPVEVVPPIFFPSKGKNHGEVIFLTNRGEMTAYTAGSLDSHEGYQVWQRFTSAIWSSKPSVSSFSLDKAVPTLETLAMRKHGPPEAILAAGEQGAVVMSPRGHQITFFMLPEAPVRPLVIADFSGDGFNDIILVTANGVYGFVQTQQPGAVLFMSLVGILITVMCVVFVMQHMNSSPKGKPTRRSTEF